jgi:hypothetical protein
LLILVELSTITVSTYIMTYNIRSPGPVLGHVHKCFCYWIILLIFVLFIWICWPSLFKLFFIGKYLRQVFRRNMLICILFIGTYFGFYWLFVWWCLMPLSTIYVIKFVSVLLQVGGFLWVPRFPPSIKLTSTIQLKVTWWC